MGRISYPFFININMKLDDLLNNSLRDFLFEAEVHQKTSLDTYKQINALKKYGFDANKTLWDNGNKVADRYKEKVIDLVIQHAINLNKEIYQYIAKNYNLGAIYWKKSNSSISQYTYFVLKNGQRLGIRVTDHKKQEVKDHKTHLMNVFYNTNFNDIIKNKIDYFIKFYSDGKNFKKVA